MFMPGADVPIVSAPGGVLRVPQPATEMIEATPIKTIKHGGHANTNDLMITPPRFLELS